LWAFLIGTKILLGTPGHSRALQGRPGDSWGLQGTPGHSLGLQRRHGDFWGFLGTPGKAWGLLGTSRDSRGGLGIPGDSWVLLGTPKGGLGTPGDSKAVLGTAAEAWALLWAPGDSWGFLGILGRIFCNFFAKNVTISGSRNGYIFGPRNGNLLLCFKRKDPEMGTEYVPISGTRKLGFWMSSVREIYDSKQTHKPCPQGLHLPSPYELQHRPLP